MEEFTTITASLKIIIEQLEDNSLQNHILKNPKYTAMQLHLSKEGYVDYDIFQRVLNICVRDLEEDIKYSAVALKIIITILKKIKEEAYSPDPAVFVPSAVCIIRKLNITSAISNVENLRDLYINTILLYPNETLVSVVSSNEAIIIELFKSHNYAQLQIEFKILLFDFLYKLLTILPPEIKLSFMKAMPSVLFSKVIPCILDDVSCITVEKDVLKYVDVLEKIINELGDIDYFKIPQWMPFLDSVCNPKKYPQMMKNLLDRDSQVWHRLWIAFINLLKSQITINTISSGTPINSMLPIVETAFKLDPRNRCRAFQCWTVLINNFSYETNENCINKRLKLLIIPMKLNNAKVEETAVAKFNTWWHLINKFQLNLEKFVEPILISFLHYMFGKHSSSRKSTFIPGQLSDLLKRQSVEALVEIMGHVNCSGCVQITRLQGRLINNNILAKYWKDWTYSLEVAIQLTLDNIEESVPQHVLCLLRSFLLTMSSLTDNNIKKAVTNDLLSIMSKFVVASKQHSTRYNDTVFALLISFFIDEVNSKEILNVTGKTRSTLYKVIKLTLDPCFKKFYESQNKREMVQKLKPLANYILQESIGLQYIEDEILSSIPANDMTLTFWTALVEYISESDNAFNLQNVYNILIWPLESLNMFNEVKYSAKLWYTTYSIMHSKFRNGDFDRDVSQVLHSSNIVTNSSVYFALCVTLAILKCGLMTDNTNKYENDVKLLQVLSKRIDCYEDIQEFFPILVDTLINVLQCYTVSNNVELAETIISCVKNVLKLMMSVFKGSSDVIEVTAIMEKLLKALDLAFKAETYSKLFYMLSDLTTFYSTIFQKLALSIFTRSSCNNQEIIKCNKDSIDKQSVIDVETKPSSQQTMKSTKFFTPNTKQIQKKTKKNEASIVNTVVENGEEFVVVKSNWKFNPKKLTENQKEKLQRKREDIPALYQDLSQSQDELNLKAWKTDSQDTLSTSKSCSMLANEGKDISSMLKNLPSTEVVPKILENILGEKEQNESKAAHNEISKPSFNIDKQLINKDCKTPRMALKDRVFRNVRNLIEKSNKQSISEGKDTMYNQIENIFRTPSPKKVSTNIVGLVKSAPPLPLSERPSRVKRKPRKFDDHHTFDSTKRHIQIYSQQEDELVNEGLSVNTIDNGSKDDKCDIIENSSLIDEIGVDVTTENNDVINEIVELMSDKSIVDPIEENTKSLRVKLVKNSIDPIIDNTNNAMKKINPDLKCSQNKTLEEQEPKGECQRSSNPDIDKSQVKSKINKRKSRIEKQLAIDMAIVYSFPNTQLISHKRSTRKSLANHVNTTKRRRLSDKLNQSPLENKMSSKQSKKAKPIKKKLVSVTAIESKDNSSLKDNVLLDDVCSEDIIESSQDSTLTTVTVIKNTLKKLPVVCIETLQLDPKLKQNSAETQNLIEDHSQENNTKSSSAEGTEACSNITLQKEACAASTEGAEFYKTKDINTVPQLNISMSGSDCQNIQLDSSLINEQSKDDTELPQNKTDDQNKSEIDLTENMNTEEICNNDLSDDVIIIDNEKLTPVTLSSEENVIEIDIHEIADAATQPVNPAELVSFESGISGNAITPQSFDNNTSKNGSKIESVTVIENDNTEIITESINLTITGLDKPNDVSSPFKDDVKRKQDFMNNTLEISPIKILSPNKNEKKSPSPNKMSDDDVVILLYSPDHSNGVSVEKESPEIFTEDKTSSDKIEYSPTRSEMNISNTSPSSALSLKKNRPQVRGGGRAAQMLGLCVPEKLHTLACSDKINNEEVKKNNPLNTPVRRNLRMLYNSTSDNNDLALNKETSGHFLKLNRLLPATDCSPPGPILKRKAVDIIDDVIISPASKRKRVSFHDPPVSTTVSVQKYIEPLGVRSPQNSAHKRHERQLRVQNGTKSPRRLDNVFNLNSALTKAVESFNDGDLPATNDDTQMISLEQTPAAEIVKTSELNDTEPICSELLNCKDPIENIAAELSSAAMKSLLIKELEGKVETIGDLAKLTEVEVNRLCIKTPKVKVAKQALNEYYLKLVDKDSKLDNMVTFIDVDLDVGDDNKIGNMETQTDKIISIDAEIQTTAKSFAATAMQTLVASTSTASIQTEESGYKSTADIIKTCILERHDFLEQLTGQLGESEMQMVVEKLPFTTMTDLYMKKIDASNAGVALSRLLDHESIQRLPDNGSETNQLSYIRDYLLERFNSKDLNLFCLNLLMELHLKST